jgi:hypothetical protein
MLLDIQMLNVRMLNAQMLDVQNPYRIDSRPKLMLIQRSRLQPYLRIKLHRDALGHLPYLSRSSICAIAWNVYAKTARNRLHGRVCPEHMSKELNEEELEEA